MCRYLMTFPSRLSAVQSVSSNGPVEVESVTVTGLWFPVTRSIGTVPSREMKCLQGFR